MEILKIAICGDSGDGRSTFLGRLQFDTNSLYYVEAPSEAAVQGFVAAKKDVNFRTDKRSFLLADSDDKTPYSSFFNQAKNADSCLMVLDVNRGFTAISQRQIRIMSILNFSELIVVVNKMDSVQFKDEPFYKIYQDLQKFTQGLNFKQIHYIPISGKLGDNISLGSVNMPWYQGGCILDVLEQISPRKQMAQLRMPIREVLQKDPVSPEVSDLFSGELATGTISEGQRIFIMPSRKEAFISSLYFDKQKIAQAKAPEIVQFYLTHDIKMHAGDIIVDINAQVRADKKMRAELYSFSQTPLKFGQEFYLSLAQQKIKVKLNKFYKIYGDEGRKSGDILQSFEYADVELKTDHILVYDSYNLCHEMGGFTLQDLKTGEALACGILMA